MSEYSNQGKYLVHSIHLKHLTKEYQIKTLVKNNFFTVIFKKKNGEMRKLNGRLNVKKYLNGGVNCNDEKTFLTVYDLKKKGYRNVNYNTIEEIRINKTHHIFI